MNNLPCVIEVLILSSFLSSFIPIKTVRIAVNNQYITTHSYMIANNNTFSARYRNITH